MRIVREMAAAGAALALFAPGQEASASSGANSQPIPLGQPAAPGQTVDGQPTDAEAKKDFCVDEALGVANNEELGDYNPADFVGSGYVGRSLRRFYTETVANAVSQECRPVIESRTITEDQIYRGKVNTRKSIVFNTLDAIDDQRRTRTLKRPFTCIPGPAIRSYKERVVMNLKYKNPDGTDSTFAKIGSRTVRGKSDGC